PVSLDVRARDAPYCPGVSGGATGGSAPWRVSTARANRRGAHAKLAQRVVGPLAIFAMRAPDPMTAVGGWALRPKATSLRGDDDGCPDRLGGDGVREGAPG